MCNVDKLPDNVEILGRASPKIVKDINGNKTIKVDISIVNGMIDNRTLKHELCHKSQLERRNILLSCNYPIKTILLEIECNTMELFNDKLFEDLYNFNISEEKEKVRVLN